MIPDETTPIDASSCKENAATGVSRVVDEQTIHKMEFDTRVCVDSSAADREVIADHAVANGRVRPEPVCANAATVVSSGHLSTLHSHAVEHHAISLKGDDVLDIVLTIQEWTLV